MTKWVLQASLCLFVSSLAHGATTISNTATLTYDDPSSAPKTVDSNTVEAEVLPNPTPAVVKFWHYSPAPADQNYMTDGGQCWDGSSYNAMPAPTTYSGNPINNSGALDLETAYAYHAGEPVFITLADGNRNKDPLVRETIMVDVTTSTNDHERLLMQETGIDSGVFAASVQSKVTPPAVAQFDCALSVATESKISVTYTDTDYITDTADANILIDPYGVVFDSSTGQPVNGVTVRIVDAITGNPAPVFGDDGVTPYPATLISGQTITVGSQTYVMPPGGYRFPLMPQGQYRIILENVPASHVWPTTVPIATLQALPRPGGGNFAINPGYRGDIFSIVAGPILHIDLPIDPLTTDLILSKTGTKSEVSAGDFLRYELLLRNAGLSQADDVTINDVMPKGFRYKQGSLHVDGVKQSDPVVSADGRSLTISTGDLAANNNRVITYVVEVTSGALKGDASNVATATRSNGLASNKAVYTVKVKHAFFDEYATIIGRLRLGKCDADDKDIKGVAKARVLMEDGTYVVTDEEGRFHIQKVTPGTHVVRVDEASLPANLELQPCDKNTRFAGRANSQFVDVQGGTLWRTDFYLRPKEFPKGSLDVKFRGEHKLVNNDWLAEMTYSLDLEVKRDLKNVDLRFAIPKGLSYLPGSATWMGSELPVTFTEGTLTIKFKELKAGDKAPLTFRAVPVAQHIVKADVCLANEEAVELNAIFELEGFDGKGIVNVTTPTCENKEMKIGEGRITVPNKKVEEKVADDDVTAGGGNRIWVDGELPGISWLWPGPKFNPRGPSTRIVIKHGALHHVELRVNGEAVSKLLFEKIHSNAEKSVLASEWKGVPLKEGDNFIEAAVRDPAGNIVELLKKTVHYATIPSKVVYAPEKSLLVANGVDKPRIAFRMLDKDGYPLRKGIIGTFILNAPFVAADFEEKAQKRVLSALERYEPEFTIISDDGLAYVDLAPTSEAGEVNLRIMLGGDTFHDIKAWLRPEVKDWVVVGFAEGTAGYKTLKGNMQDVPDADKNKELQTNSQLKLYAKGKVSSKWIMTVAYDSEKRRREATENNFKGVIDPGEFYTLYGDTTTQRSDAPSSEKLYFKIEREKFYALFGDYDAGLTDTELSRYNRSFTGVKSELATDHFAFKVFASQEENHYFKEEIQGQGTAFLYRLAKAPILLNSEKITIQTRDRFRSEKIISEKSLQRHLDYRFDYSAGTVTFKSPISATDSNFNPQFIMVEYETLGAATDDITYGGRVEGRTADQKVRVGATHINESDGLKKSSLEGLDAKIKIAEQTELQLEGATSKNNPNGSETTGEAYRAEIEHRSPKIDVNTYVSRTSEGFGIGQNAASEQGTFKTGVDSAYHVTPQFDVKGGFNHQDQLASDATRDVANVGVRYGNESGSAEVGVRRIEETRAGEESEQNEITTTLTKRMFNNKFELQGLVEQNIASHGTESVDYPSRYMLKGTYSLTDKTRVFVAQEYTDGDLYDSSTTRAGFETVPWAGAKLNNTVNQESSEAGPRTYSTMGMAQSITLGKKWTLDASLDTSQTFNQTGPASPFNASHPNSSGGFLGNGSFTEDYIAVSAGVGYRDEPWSWNLRVEDRMGEVEQKYGLMTNVIRELNKGTVLSSSLAYYASRFEGGANGQLLTGDVSLAYRPLDSRWTILDKLKFRYETVDNAQSLPIFGQATLKGVEDALSSAIVNNFNLNHLSKRRKNQYSLFYGSKIVMDKYDGVTYQSFTDLIGLEMRQDLTEKWDVGFQGSALNSWTAGNNQYSFGPSIGWSPTTNGWVSLGYNFQGFYDRDFDAARYTQQGIYLKVRMKFDEKSLGLKKSESETK